ncbi:MAG: sigma-54-dependent Fis family transcriptional regulator [Verrucomicrobiales bacterium]|nr:sigma-54-dependent Fis family transcriptional regulator [Verrucomicrobiales bacterium]
MDAPHLQSPSTPDHPWSCLLMEDDPGFAAMIQEVLIEEGWQVLHCNTVAATRETYGRRAFDLMVFDNHLPDGKGFDLYVELAKRDPSQTVIMLTGLPELAHAVELTRQGLFDYLAKPATRDAFVASIRRAKARLESRRVPGHQNQLVASSPAMREVALALEQAARHPSAIVLFTGETGSGKDAAARTLHALTHPKPTASTPFIPVNCAAVPAEMFESELFGAERGAYTGADKTREGLAAAAREGTLFLDEIGEVPLALQAKLLRFLEAREFRPLGGTTTKTFNARLVAATNRTLADEVAAGRFREDLLYRLDVFTIHLPPLRDRRSEIPALADLLLTQLAEKYQRSKPAFRDEDLAALHAYPFPGNVRELRNLLERSLLRTPSDGSWLALDRLWLNRATPASPTSTASASQATQAVHTPNAPVASPAPPAAPPHLPPLEAGEYLAIQQALMDCQGGIRRAAARLGITHQALLRRLEKWPELRKAGSPPSPS